MIAALGPKNVALAAELAEGWQPIFYFPEKAGLTWDAPLAAGQGQARPGDLGPLDVIAAAPLAIGDDVAHLRDLDAPGASRSTSAAWARAARTSTTTWPAASATRSEAKQIQDAYLSGRKDEAAALVPAELVEKTSLVGPLGYVKERLAAYREAGVTTLNVTSLAPTHERRVKDIETLRALAG